MIAINPLYAYDFWTTIWAGQILIFFEFSSILSFLVLSVNRFSAVYFVLLYRRLFNKKRVWYYLISVWSLSLIISCLNLIPDCHQYFEPLNFAFSIMDTSCGNWMKHGAYYIPKLAIRIVCIVADVASLIKLKMIESLSKPILPVMIKLFRKKTFFRKHQARRYKELEKRCLVPFPSNSEHSSSGPCFADQRVPGLLQFQISHQITFLDSNDLIQSSCEFYRYVRFPIKDIF